MGTVLVQSIFDRAAIILNDTDNVRWPAVELLKWFNDGQREVVKNKPDANATTIAMVLAAGTRQAIPSTGIQLIDVSRNMGTDGLTPGAAITFSPRRVFDLCYRNWHTATSAAAVQNYMYDGRDPKCFYVFPPSPGTNYVEVIYSAGPADILIADISTEVVTLPDIYANPLLDYILYRAFSKDGDLPANTERAVAAYQAFITSLGLKNQTEKQYDPNLNPATAG